MKSIKLVVTALALTCPVALPAVASASASPSHFVLRDKEMFTEFFWKADPTTTCGPEAHVITVSGYETTPSNGSPPDSTPFIAVFIEYFDRCTGAYESTFATSTSDQPANVTIRGLSGTETGTAYPIVCGVDSCAPDLSNPIGVNLSVAATTTSHDHLSGHGHGSYYQFSFTFSDVSHFGPVSGSVTFTTSSGQMLTVFPNYTDPLQPLQTGAGAGGALSSSSQTDVFVSFQ